MNSIALGATEQKELFLAVPKGRAGEILVKLLPFHGGFGWKIMNKPAWLWELWSKHSPSAKDASSELLIQTFRFGC